MWCHRLRTCGYTGCLRHALVYLSPLLVAAMFTLLYLAASSAALRGTSCQRLHMDVARASLYQSRTWRPTLPC